MKRILCIVSSMNTGGAETFLMKLYRNFDKTKYQMDFLVSESKKGFYDDEIISMGGKIYYIPPKSKNPLKSFCGIKTIVKENKYENVMRVGAHSLATMDLLAAKLGGANNLILRSSNANVPKSLKIKISHYIFKFLPKIIPTIKLAPSTEAAIFTFGKSQVSKNKVKILNNAVDFDEYKFNPEKRDFYRKELNIEDKLVIGHVGRFNEQKNHKFLLDIFYELYKKNKESVLLLIGKGELETTIKEYAEKLGILNKTIFLGVRKDTNYLYSVMDVYVFPSLYEGMPNTVIEAQASGLKCILSDTITREANITNSIEYISLKESAEQWSNLILNVEKKHNDYRQNFIDNKYEIKTITNEFLENIK